MTVLFKHPFRVVAIFLIAYFTSFNVQNVSLQAQAQDMIVSGDAIQLQANDQSIFTGTITKVDRDRFDMTNGDNTFRVLLRDVRLRGSAQTVFTPGMYVTVRGDMRGDSFGIMTIRARNVVASQEAGTAVIRDPAYNLGGGAVRAF